MMVKRLKSAAMASLVGATLLAAPVAAQDNVAAANRADAQCLAISAILMGDDEATKANPDLLAGGMLMLGYYMGRVEGRSPNFDMTSLLADVVQNDLADETQIASLTERCMVELDGLSDRMSKSAEALEALN
jgi:hypothetical protein